MLLFFLFLLMSLPVFVAAVGFIVGTVEVLIVNVIDG